MALHLFCDASVTPDRSGWGAVLIAQRGTQEWQTSGAQFKATPYCSTVAEMWAIANALAWMRRGNLAHGHAGLTVRSDSKEAIDAINMGGPKGPLPLDTDTLGLLGGKKERTRARRALLAVGIAKINEELALLDLVSVRFRFIKGHQPGGLNSPDWTVRANAMADKLAKGKMTKGPKGQGSVPYIPA